MWIAFSDNKIVAICSALEKALIDCPLTRPLKYCGMHLTWQEEIDYESNAQSVVHKSDLFFSFNYEIKGTQVTQTNRYILVPGVHEFTGDDFRAPLIALDYYSTDLTKARIDVEFYCKDKDAPWLAGDIARAVTEFPHGNDEHALKVAMQRIYCNYLEACNRVEN